MNYRNIMAALLVGMIVCSCSSLRSGGEGLSGREIETYLNSFNRYDLIVAEQGVTYTIDISTAEGRIKLEGTNLKEAEYLALQEAAIANNAACLISPKFSYLKRGRHVLRVTVFGFPARYKNVEKHQ